MTMPTSRARSTPTSRTPRAAAGWPSRDDVNALLPRLWSREVAKDADGVLTVAGLQRDRDRRAGRHAGLRGRRGRPARPGPGLRGRRSPAGTSTTPASRSSAPRSPAGSAEEGLGVDVCTGGELAVALRAGVDPAPDRPARQQQERRRAAGRRSTAGVGRIIVDSFDEIAPARRCWPRSCGVRPRVMVRVTTGVEAHTHEYIATAHEDQKFGFSIAGGSRGRGAAAPATTHPALDLVGIHSHIGSQIFDAEGFEVAARRTLRLHAEFAAQTGVELPELDLGGGFGIAYTSSRHPGHAGRAGRGAAARSSTHECAALGIARAAPVDRARPGDQRAERLRAVPGRHGQAGRRWTAARSRLYVAVDGGMSDNIRTALYAAEYSATLASRRSRRAGRRWPGWSASTARAATSWSATSSCPPTSRPAT